MLQRPSTASVLLCKSTERILPLRYFPNGGDPERMPFKMTYSRAIQHRVDRLVKRGRHVIVVGDVNVAHRAVDHCDPAKSMRELGITEYGDTAARRWFDKFVYPRGAMVDVFRDMNPEARGRHGAVVDVV